MRIIPAALFDSGMMNPDGALTTSIIVAIYVIPIAFFVDFVSFLRVRGKFHSKKEP
jgi:hypothetical protein